LARAKKLPIFERFAPDGRLLGYRVRIRQLVKGQKPIRIEKQYDRIEDARDFCIRELERINAGVYVDREEIRRTTLSDALDRYDREIGPTKKRPDGVTAYVRRWKRHPLASRVIATLQPIDFATYRDERLAAGLSGNAVRLELGLVRHLYTIGIKEWGWPVSNPISNIRMPKCAPGRERRLDATPDEDGRTEEERLIAACDAGKSRWLTAIVKIAIETAMRQGEILALRWENIDLKKGTAHLPDTKNGTARTVPLSPAAIKVLSAVPRNIDEGRDSRVFPIGSMSVTHAFQRACVRAKIDGLRFHDLRHEATSRLFEQGFGIQDVAAITGHKTLQMLKRYTHLRAEDLAAKLAKLQGTAS